MDSHSLLAHTLKDILEVIKPLREDWEVRSKIIDDLKDVIMSVESLRDATVEPFGSFVSNLFTRWGDLDISIILANGSYFSSAAKKRKQNLLRDCHKALRQKGGWRRLQFVPQARVPILKFESNHQNISCDVSIDNLQGQMKSKFLFWINQMDGRFREMVLLVKEWAKAHNINNPKSGTLNSYSLSLLVIFHFQTCVPAILPPLKEIYPRSVVDDLTGMRCVAEEHIEQICTANISRYMSDKYRAINRSSLSGLFISFLAKFSGISSNAAELGLCTFTGQWQDINSTTRWLPKTYALFIEDPFEQPENTARAVTAGNLIKISEAIQTTYNKLVSANQNRASVLGTLLRPEILNFIAGTPVRNPSYTTFHCQSTRPQTRQATHSPLQVQQQFQNTRHEKHPNFFTKQRQESYPHNPNSQHPVQKTKPKRNPYYFANQEHESHQENTRMERHPKYLAKNRQETHLHNSSKLPESNLNNWTRQKPAQKYNGQGQHIWRPKSDGQRQFLRMD